MVDMFNDVGLIVHPILLSWKKEGSPQEVIKIDGWHEAKIFMGQCSIINKRIGCEVSHLSLSMQWSESLIGGSAGAM